MGARKRSKKKNNPNRHKAFMRIRKDGDTSEIFTTRNGAEIVINPIKKILKGQEYVNREFRDEVNRKMARYAMGTDKKEEVEEGVK